MGLKNLLLFFSFIVIFVCPAVVLKLINLKFSLIKFKQNISYDSPVFFKVSLILLLLMLPRLTRFSKLWVRLTISSSSATVSVIVWCGRLFFITFA